MRQKSRQLELPLGGEGETPRAQRSGEASTAANGNGRSGTDYLMEEVVGRDNLKAALKRVRKNKGSPGSDGRRAKRKGERNDREPQRCQAPEVRASGATAGG